MKRVDIKIKKQCCDSEVEYLNLSIQELFLKLFNKNKKRCCN